MSEKNINKTARSDEIRWFGIKLNQTSNVILFFLALIGVIEGTTLWLSIFSIITYIRFFGFLSLMVSSQIFSIIIGVGILGISCYTLFICVKSRKSDNEIHHNMNSPTNTINWFGFALSKTSAIILFFLSLIGIVPTISSLYYNVINYINYLHSFFTYGGDTINVLSALSLFYLLSTLISKLVIYSYSIVRFSQARKITDRYI